MSNGGVGSWCRDFALPFELCTSFKVNLSEIIITDITNDVYSSTSVVDGVGKIRISQISRKNGGLINSDMLKQLLLQSHCAKLC